MEPAKQGTQFPLNESSHTLCKPQSGWRPPTQSCGATVILYTNNTIKIVWFLPTPFQSKHLQKHRQVSHKKETKAQRIHHAMADRNRAGSVAPEFHSEIQAHTNKPVKLNDRIPWKSLNKV